MTTSDSNSTWCCKKINKGHLSHYVFKSLCLAVVLCFREVDLQRSIMFSFQVLSLIRPHAWLFFWGQFSRTIVSCHSKLQRLLPSACLWIINLCTSLWAAILQPTQSNPRCDGLAIALALLGVPGDGGCCALSLLVLTPNTPNGATQGLVKVVLGDSYFWTSDTKKTHTDQFIVFGS